MLFHRIIILCLRKPQPFKWYEAPLFWRESWRRLVLYMVCVFPPAQRTIDKKLLKHSICLVTRVRAASDSHGKGLSSEMTEKKIINMAVDHKTQDEHTERWTLFFRCSATKGIQFFIFFFVYFVVVVNFGSCSLMTPAWHRHSMDHFAIRQMTSYGFLGL